MKLVGALVFLAITWPGCCRAQAPTCQPAQELGTFKGHAVALVGDALVFRVDEIALDIDGAPTAYGVRDHGLEDICNGLGALEPARCRNAPQRGECYGACRAAFAAWTRDGNSDPRRLGEFMSAIGLGGGAGGVPQVRLQDAPHDDFFVSETSLKTSPPTGVPTAGWTATQAAQIDSTRVSYFVIPAGFRRLPWDVTPGDAGVVLDLASGRMARFVVGDVGGQLDEGSARLLEELRGSALDRRKVRGALDAEVERLVGAMTGEFAVAIFRHTNALAPAVPGRNRQLVVAQTADELVPWIATAAATALDAMGGEQCLRARVPGR